MMTRLLSILLYGTLFWLAFLFLFYSGLYTHYIQANGIDIFFNRFFMTTQVWWLWPLGIGVLGILFMSEWRRPLKATGFAVAFLVAATPWVPAWGEAIGYRLFAKAPVTYRFDRIVVTGATLLFHADGYDYVRVPGKKRVLRYPSSRRAGE